MYPNLLTYMGPFSMLSYCRKQEERIGGKNSLCFSLIHENIYIQNLI